MTSDQIDRELRQTMRDAALGVPTAARRAAELLALLDREGDAAVMYRFAAELGDHDAAVYVAEFVRGDTILATSHNDPDDLLEAVLERQREAVAGVVDTTWLNAAIAEIQTVPICQIHRVPEPDKPGDFRTCLECQHVWRTEQEFIADVLAAEAAHRKAAETYGDGQPPGFASAPPTEPRDQSFCPLCSHDF